MEKIVRYFTLSLLLIIPIAVFLFLKNFGDNQFNIPVFYQSGVNIDGCSNKGEVHSVSIKGLSSDKNQAIYVCYLPQYVDGISFYDGLDRILNKWNKIELIGLVGTDTNNAEIGKMLLVDQDLLAIINCELILGQDKALDRIPDNKIVLIDNKFHIRGYYQGEILEEIDRLDVEIDILYKEYLNETK